MPMPMNKLEAALQNKETPVFYVASTEAPLLQEAALKIRQAILREGDEETRIDGPVPNMDEAVQAAGTLSFFGTRRVVELREISPSTMTDKDIEELCSLFADLANAVLLVTALYKDGKTASSKKAKALLSAATKAGGLAIELAKPTKRENIQYLQLEAEKLGARFAAGAADVLLERAGEDRVLLRSETEKLAAISGYQEITRQMVENYATANIEADVFELARTITGRRQAAAFAKLDQLLSLRHEPIAITAALAGTFVDMYRVRAGAMEKVPVGVVFKEMGYRGSEYRLQKAKENAAKYTTEQLEECVLCLAELDASLKSSALSDKSILLQAAVGKLFEIGAR